MEMKGYSINAEEYQKIEEAEKRCKDKRTSKKLTVLLIRFSGVSIAETAQRMNCSERKVARRVIRDFTERDPERNKINNLFENLNFTMKAYLNHDRMMYIQHIDTVKPFCDFFVDGTGNIEDIVKSIIETISQVQKSNNVLE